MSAIADEIKTALREVLREELSRMFGQEQLPLSGRPAADDGRLLNVDEAAQRLGLAAGTVYRKAAKCELPSVKLGERVLFRPADLDAYAEARRRSPERVRELVART